MTDRMIRWSGPVAVGSSVLFSASLTARHLLFRMDLVRDGIRFPFMVLHIIAMVAAIFLLLSLTGFYARQAAAAGRFGLLAFVVTFIGWTMAAGALWFLAFGVPLVAQLEPGGSVLEKNPYRTADIFSFTLAGIGLLLFCLASWRARVFPRWAIVLLLVGDTIWGLWSAVNPPGLPYGEMALAAGLSAMGVALWMEGGKTRESAPVLDPVATHWEVEHAPR